MNTFFICPKCGNDKEFKIFTTNYQDIRQSANLGMHVDESNLYQVYGKEILILNANVVFKELSMIRLQRSGKDISR